MPKKKIDAEKIEEVINLIEEDTKLLLRSGVTLFSDGRRASNRHAIKLLKDILPPEPKEGEAWFVETTDYAGVVGRHNALFNGKDWETIYGYFGTDHVTPIHRLIPEEDN